MDAKRLMQLVASVERYSKHPLSSAILKRAREEHIELVDAKQISEPKGKGLKGLVNGHHVIITSRNQLEQYGLQDKAARLPNRWNPRDLCKQKS